MLVCPPLDKKFTANDSLRLKTKIEMVILVMSKEPGDADIIIAGDFNHFDPPWVTNHLQKYTMPSHVHHYSCLDVFWAPSGWNLKRTLPLIYTKL